MSKLHFGTTTTHFGRRITAQIRRAGGRLRVYALPTNDFGHGEAVCVGYAATWKEAQDLIHAAGYRIMRTGGLAEVTEVGGFENILVTVYPRD